MSLWDDVAKEFDKDIEKAATEYINATNVLPYTVAEIKSVFRPEELEEVAGFIREMRSAGNDNEKKAEIINKSMRVVEGLLRLGKFLV
jgi:hypothetical protein